MACFTLCSVEELAVKGFDAAGGAAMKMFLTVRGDAVGLVGWAI
jgi:hypothetical protein